MIIHVATSLLETGGLGFADHPEGAADFEAEFLHARDRVQHAVELLAIVHAAPGSAHAEAGRAAGLGLTGIDENRLRLHEGFALEAGLIVDRLRTIGAVFGAGAGLDRLQRAELHAGRILIGLVDLLSLEDQRVERQVVERSGFGEVGHWFKKRVLSMEYRVSREGCRPWRGGRRGRGASLRRLGWRSAGRTESSHRADG